MKLKRIIVLTLMVLLSASACYAWDITYDKDGPLGSVSAATLDTEIQNHKKANVERLNVDHFFGDSNNDLNALTCGYHRQVTLYELSTAATTTGFSVVYNSTTSNLHFLSDDWGDVQITDEDALAVTGDVTMSNLSISTNLSVGNDTHIGSDLSVDGDAAIDGDATIGNELFVDGNPYSQWGIKGWVNFAGSSTINDSYNVTSVTANATGDFTITWDTDFADTKYVVTGTAIATGGDAFTVVSLKVGTTLSAGACTIVTENDSGTNVTCNPTMVIAIGAQ